MKININDKQNITHNWIIEILRSKKDEKAKNQFKNLW